MNRKSPELPHFIEILKRTLAEREKAEPSYSLRLFARDMSVDSSALSRILRGKQAPTLKIARQMADSLALSKTVRHEFFVSIGEQRLLTLADSLAECIDRAVAPRALLESMLNKVKGIVAVELFDFEVYRSVLKLLPGYAAVLAVDGRILLKNDRLGALDTSLQQGISEPVEWSQRQEQGLSFEQEFNVVDENEQKQSLTFRCSAIRTGTGTVVGWLATRIVYQTAIDAKVSV